MVHVKFRHSNHHAQISLSLSLSVHLFIYAYSHCLIFHSITCCSRVCRSSCTNANNIWISRGGFRRRIQSTDSRRPPARRVSHHAAKMYPLSLKKTPSASGLLWSAPPPPPPPHRTPTSYALIACYASAINDLHTAEDVAHYQFGGICLA